MRTGSWYWWSRLDIRMRPRGPCFIYMIAEEDVLLMLTEVDEFLVLVDDAGYWAVAESDRGWWGEMSSGLWRRRL